jgi:hypothetical protein
MLLYLKRKSYIIILWFLVIYLTVVSLPAKGKTTMISPPQLLTDPFLQLPTENSVRVVWFTEFVGDKNLVVYGEKLDQNSLAKTTKLSRIRED